MRPEEMKQRAASLRARAERLTNSIRQEARRVSVQAGLDPNLLGIHPHNALCAFEAGQPWRGVDYRLVRRVHWLVTEKMHEPSRLVDRVVSRMLARTDWGSP